MPARLMAEPSLRHATLSRGQRAAIAFGLLVAIGALAFVLPEQHLGYAEIVPLLLLARAYGLFPGIVMALVSAPLLEDFQHRIISVSWDAFAIETFFLSAVFIAVLAVVDRYEDVLVRSYRSENAWLSTLPAQVRREEEVTRERDLIAIAEAIPQLVWRSRGDGTAEYFNAAWISYTGIEPSAPYEQGLQSAIYPEDAPTVRTRWEDAKSDGTDYVVEFRMRARDGTYRWFLARATPLRDLRGRITRWFGTCTDIDDQKRAHERLERRFEVAHRVSEAFQEASLPATLPVVPGVRFSALYRAGRREATVGGDWYDALQLLDGRVLVSVGDVAGSGLGAAITMVAVRQAIRGAAQIHADPLIILEAADRTLRQEAPERMVTAFVGVYDPITGELAYASAGHPSPFLRSASGLVSELPAPGLPLGVRRKGDSEARSVMLEAGSVFVCYTDGLVESTHDLVAGERRLRAAIAKLDPRADGAAERVARAALAGPARDDVAILTLTFDSICGQRYRRWTLDANDRFAAREMQVSFAAAMTQLGASGESMSDAELVLAELLGNVVRHASHGPCEIVLDGTTPLPVLNVLDRGVGFTSHAHRRADEFAESGRGLFIVRALTAEFNASQRPGGGTHARAVLCVERRRFVPQALAQAVSA